ncbi:MAG: lipopolysaccharide biosynthesis protein [Fibrobacter sp.]|uniref:lipopolysaccharide biosynthesis protein n=1 Tax=Fibrobacter sp. TaxID=35828 RepID=UPI002A91744C|nr:lipopolysaccharide biosynthesis protein [Fibrobacter sp.]MDY6263409.1 lipopolysaccharide biosynthesis protein [Fibrobacter sp.]
MQASNKKIIKNTIALYFRQFLVLTVSLYTYRVVLANLGVTDFGIYNVVGGVVAMFSLLSSSMATATNRFLSFDLGRGNFVQLRKTFNLSFVAYLCTSFFLIILAETIGVWFVSNKLVIPEVRMSAAFVVYQSAIVSFIFTICTIPCTAMIIAHENMSVYAYVSIFDVMSKLIIAFLIKYSSVDKLALYGLLITISTFVVSSYYWCYCYVKYKECHLLLFWNKKKFFQLFSFAGWNLFGAASGLIKNQGINILLNMFFGPVVNAARAIAMQVNNSVCLFAQNFFTAVQPQIIKNYANKESEKMLLLMIRSGKMTFCLMLLVVMPLFLETPTILALWLKEVPEDTVIFSRLVLVESLIESMSYPIGTALNATGRVKVYQIVVGSIQIMNFPFAFVALYCGAPAYGVMILSIVISMGAFVARLFILKRNMFFSVSSYFRSVVLFSLIMLVITSVIPCMENCVIPHGVGRLILTIFSSSIIILLFFGFKGLTKQERDALLSAIKGKILRTK